MSFEIVHFFTNEKLVQLDSMASSSVPQNEASFCILVILLAPASDLHIYKRSKFKSLYVGTPFDALLENTINNIMVEFEKLTGNQL